MARFFIAGTPHLGSATRHAAATAPMHPAFSVSPCRAGHRPASVTIFQKDLCHAR